MSNEIEDYPGKWYQPLFNLMVKEYDQHLVQSEMDEIISVVRKMELPSPLTDLPTSSLKWVIEKRIKELNDADEEYCTDRWGEGKSEFVRKLAREESNKVTFARQELQEILKSIPESAPTEPLPDAGYWKDVILKRIEYFASKWHKFESRELREALNTIERLVPPDQFQQLKQTPAKDEEQG